MFTFCNRLLYPVQVERPDPRFGLGNETDD